MREAPYLPLVVFGRSCSVYGNAHSLLEVDCDEAGREVEIHRNLFLSVGPRRRG